MYNGELHYLISEKNNGYMVRRFVNLASARICEEQTMKATDDSVKWWNKWIYREKWYNGDKIKSNIKDATDLRYKYGNY